MQNMQRKLFAGILIILFMPVISYSEDSRKSRSFLLNTTNYFAVENLNRSFKKEESVFNYFGELVGKYIDRHCWMFNYKTSKDLRELGTTACQKFPFEIKDHQIGMASIHALRKIIMREMECDDVKSQRLDNLFGDKRFDIKFLFSLKDIRPIVTCKFFLLHKIRFRAYISPLEGKSVGNVEIPFSKRFHLTLNNRLSFTDFHLDNAVFCRGTIRF